MSGGNRKNTGADERLIITRYFYFSDKKDFEKLNAAPIKRLHSQDSRATSRRQVEQHSLFGDALKHSLLKKERVARRTTYTLMRRRSK